MFIRIVKMKFQSDKVDEFLSIFDQNKERIRHFEGCKHLELLRDLKDPDQFFTYSYWESESHLEAYRESDLFREVWRFTKALFQERAEAWSVDQRTILP